MEYVFGKNAVSAYLNTQRILEIYITKEVKNSEYFKKICKYQINVIEKNKSFLDDLVHSKKHQGIVAKIKDFEYADYENTIKLALSKEYPVILMLDGIEDPHNLGAIIRSVEAFQVDAIIIGKHNCVPVNGTVAKVSTGALANVHIIQVSNLTKTLIDLKKKGFWVVEAEANQGVDYTTLDYHMPVVLVVGSEGFGISRLVKEQADYNVFIPMYGKVNSLNVSVATAILLAKIMKKN